MPQGDVPTVYLSFDDGPHPTATPFVLEQLRRCDARATFFCIGKNAAAYPHILRQIVEAGHTTGNHTYNHLNGWETSTEDYIDNIAAANEFISSRIFRPPYGRITRRQAARLLGADPAWKVYMWSVLSADFDTALRPEQCLDNVLKHISPGAIVVFHDSAKAWERLRYTLPFVLDYCKEQGWKLSGLPT